MSTPQNPGQESPFDASGAPQPERAQPGTESAEQYAQQLSFPDSPYSPQPWAGQQQPQQPWLEQQSQPMAGQPQPQVWPDPQQYVQPQYQLPYPGQQQYAPQQQYETQQHYTTQQPNPPQYEVPGTPYATDPEASYAATYGPPPHMPPGPKPKRMWILWVSIAAGLVMILTLGAAAYEFSKIFSVLTPQPSPTVQASPEPSLASDGELYKQTDALLTEMIEKYQAMSVDEIAVLFPGGAAGYDVSYVRDFQVLLEDLDRRLKEIGEFTVYDGIDYETEILNIQTDADDLEWSFLRQKGFSHGVSVTLADGTFYDSDGRYFPQGTPSYNAGREAFAQSFVPYLDGNGSYAAAGEELVAGLGMKLSYDFQEMFTQCPPDGFVIQDTGGIGAAYCPALRDTIYVNGQGNNYPNILYDLYYIDLLKHEFAHVRMTGICATSQPAVTLGGAHFEATASSYAAMFLGADRDRLAWSAADYPDYTMTEATDQAAQLIHDGACG